MGQVVSDHVKAGLRKPCWELYPAHSRPLAVLVGILLNQVGLSSLLEEIRDLRKHVDSQIAALRKQLHDDIVMLVGRDTYKSERLARLEERSKS